MRTRGTAWLPRMELVTFTQVDLKYTVSYTSTMQYKKGAVFKAGVAYHIDYIWVTEVHPDGSFDARGGMTPFVAIPNQWVFTHETHSTLFSAGLYKLTNWGWKTFYESI